MERCGLPCKDGHACPWPKPCKVHREDGSTRRRPKPPPRPVTNVEAGSGTLPVPAVVRDRDLRELAWWLVEGVIGGDVAKDTGSVLVSAMRVLAALGPEGPGDDEVAAETALRARLAFGMPPTDAESWEMAERILDGETLAEVKRQVAAARRRLGLDEEV